MALPLDRTLAPFPASTRAPDDVREVRKAIATGLLLFVIFNLNLRAIVSRDSRIIALTAASIGLSHTATLDRFPDVRGDEGASIVNGHLVPLYPLVPAIVAAPAFGLAAAVGILDRINPSTESIEAISKVTASLLTAAACSALYLLVRRWVPGAPAAFVVSAAALSTPYWSTASQALWGHATAACALAIALWACSRMEVSWHAAVIAGLGVAASVCTRPLLAPFVAGFVVYARRSPHVGWLLSSIASVVVSVTWWNVSLVGQVLGGMALLESPDVHQQTHLVDSAWTFHLLDGARGILFSPNRGLLIFMPLVCWTIVGGVRLWRRSVEARLTIIIPTALYLIGWSAYAVWWGGHSYGPRYATDLVVPFTITTAAAFFDGTRSITDWPRWSQRVASVALVWSIGVQAIGAFCYPDGNWNDLPLDVDTAHARLWDWSDLEIVRTAAAGPHTQQLGRLTRLLPSRAMHARTGQPDSRH